MVRIKDISTGERARAEFVDREGFDEYREVRMYGHVFGFGASRETVAGVAEQVLFRDGQEFCRRSGWENGLPCVFHPAIHELAGTHARSMSVLHSLASIYHTGYGEVRYR